MRAKSVKKASAGRSLNLVLWLVLSLFAVAVLVVCLGVQNALAGRQYSEETAHLLRETGERAAEILRAETDESAAGRLVYETAAEAGASVRVLYPDGEGVFSPFGETERDPQFAAYLNGRLSDRDSDFFKTDDALSFVLRTEFAGEECFLCLSASFAPLGRYAASLGWLSLVAVLLAVVLAFAASGLLAFFITKPVTEITERAKELARGNYELDFKRPYFCLEVNELSEALAHARDEIAKADRMQKELIANVSHDFKTPLTMIKAYASMILEISGDDPVKRGEHARVIVEESDRLASLVGDVLELSRLRAGGRELNKTVFNLSEDVYRVAGRFSYLEETQGYRIETEVESDLYSYTDREGVGQVLYNLIGNAVNYTGEEKRVRVRLFRKEGKLRFEVIDFGKGIPREELDSIWERYYRSEETHKRPVQGSGLGLSIVKSILLAQECPFGVVSEVGKGSCFWAEFPPAETEKEEK